MPAKNQLFYGDNLDVLRKHVPDQSVDLIYLDPPFNSNATYNVLFKSHAGDEARAQIEAFDDTWHWGPQADEEYDELTKGGAPLEVARFIESMRDILGTSDMTAYLVMMAPRLVELRRVLKPSGSIYLHCDPTASHYLKILMDSVFGPENFQNEVIWRRTASHESSRRWPRLHDVLLDYSKQTELVAFTGLRTAADAGWIEREYRYEDKRGRYSLDNLTGAGTSNGPSGQPWRGADPAKIGAGRHWRYHPDTLDKLDAEERIYWPPRGKYPKLKQYLSESKGASVGDIWTDIPVIGRTAAERLGYPTQKPIALLERIITASTKPGDMVLDPFCGCGTAVDAAQQLGRNWIGMDITYIAVDLIVKRLQHRYGDEILATFTTNGIPKDVESADALFARNPFEFERWAVSFVNGQPNEKQVGDKGIDGRIRFDNGRAKTGMVAVSVKGGKQQNPAMVQALAGAMHQEGADMGVLITMGKPTRGMAEAASKGGTYDHALTGNRYPKLQIISIPELFDGKRPNLPTVILPYIRAARRPEMEDVPLFGASPENPGML